MMLPTRVRACALWLALGFALPAGLSSGQDTGLKVGDAAPPFSLPGSDGRLHSLSEHLGVRPVVVAWFPKAFTKL
jgi:peroxiredoxin Q/BCP